MVRLMLAQPRFQAVLSTTQQIFRLMRHIGWDLGLSICADDQSTVDRQHSLTQGDTQIDAS